VVSPVDGYWGRSGWTVVEAGDLAEPDLAGFLRMAWARVAPKKLLAASLNPRP